MKNNKGFTLIEMLVAISIMAIISTIGVSTYQDVQSKGRDNVRKQNLNTLATALEIYFQKHGSYVPGSNQDCRDSQVLYLSKENDPQNIGLWPYISGEIPKDPISGEAYCYVSLNNGASYRLFARLENCLNDGDSLYRDDPQKSTKCSSAQYSYTRVSEDQALASAPSDPPTLLTVALPGATPSPAAGNVGVGAPLPSPAQPGQAPTGCTITSGSWDVPNTSATNLAGLDIKGNLTGLLPNTSYRVLACLQDGECSSGGNLSIRTDENGSAIFSGLNINVPHASGNPVTKVSVVEVVPPPSPPPSASLQANYALAAGPTTVTFPSGGSLTITQTPVVTLGQSVSLKVETSGNCTGKKINFEIREYDGPSASQPITANPQPADIIGNLAQISWAAEYQCDGGIDCGDDPPEYLFNSNVEGEPNVVRSANPKLQVTEPEPIPIPKPDVSTLTATEISANSAKLNAQIHPKGLPTQASFRWGPTETSDCSTLPFDSNTVNPEFGSGTQLQNYSAAISEHSNNTLRLLPATDYWVCAQAESSAGGTYGNVAEFRTKGIPPTIAVFDPPNHVSGIALQSGAINRYKANVKAKINPQNQVTKAWYRYGTSTTNCDLLPNKIPNDDVGREIGTGLIDISDQEVLRDLLPLTTYYFCAQAQNPTLPITYGAVQSFTTPTLAPTIKDADTVATNITQTSAKLNTKINPNNQNTTYQFKYGTNNTTNCSTLPNAIPATSESIGSGVNDIAKEQTIANLLPAQTYRFCVVATNATGTTSSAVGVFDTLRIPPTIISETASDITHNSAKLNATINPNNLPTNYLFRYGTLNTTACNELESTIPVLAAVVGSGVSNIIKQQTLLSLEPGLTYRFCVEASNDDGNSATVGDGPNTTIPQSFTTFNYTLAASSHINIDQTDADGESTTITVTKDPGNAADGTASLSATGLPSGATITLTPTGCTPNPTCTITATVFTSGVTTGTRTITIQSSPIGARTTTFNLNVRDSTRPTAPTNLAATTASHSQINLSWNPSTDNIAVTGYDIYRGTTLIGSVNGAQTTYQHTGLPANTLHDNYTVNAKDAATNVSDPSNTASATTFTRPPSSFDASPVSDQQVDLSWNAPGGSVKYNIYRDNTLIHTLEDATCTNCGYSDIGRSANTSYSYKVTSINSVNGESLPSETKSALTKSSAPTGLTATAASASQIDLSWTASAGGADSYKIFRCSNPPANDCTPAPPELTDNLTGTGTSRQNTALSANTTYRYTVRANNATGDSAPTAIVAANTLCADDTTPGPRYQDDDADGYGDRDVSPINGCAPSDGHIYVQSVVNNNDCNDDVANIFQTKNVSEDKDRDGYSIGTLSNSCVGTALDPPHISSRTYYKGAGGSHIWWEGSSATADCDDDNAAVGPCPPSTPQNLRAIAVSSSHIRLRWTPSTGATQYDIARCTNSDCSPTSFGTSSLSPDFLNNTGLTCGTTYRYKIRANNINTGLTSGETPTVQATTYACGDENLLANAGFESGTLDEWGCVGNGSGTCEIGSIADQSGNYAVKVHDSGSTFGWQIAQGGISHSTSQNEPFCLSARVRKAYNDGDSGSVGFTASLAIQESAPPWQDRRIGTVNNGAIGSPHNEWRTARDNLTAPSSWTPTIQVFARVAFSGQEAWFDDVKLTRGVCPNPPSAPTNVTATAGNAQATVTWTAPSSDGGAAITSYIVTSSPGNITATLDCSLTPNPCTAPLSKTVTGLTNDTSYTFTVKATNSAGTSSPSTASNQVAVTDNLLVNAGFELGTLDNWFCNTSNSSNSCTRDSSTIRPGSSGSYSAKLVDLGSVWGTELIAQPTITANLGDQFCLSGWLKKNAGVGAAFLSIQKASSPWQQIRAFGNNQTSTNWQQIPSTTVTVPSFFDPYVIQVNIGTTNAPNIVWFDDVKLTRGSCIE